MNFDIQTTPRFDKDVKRLQKRFPRIKQDLIALANDLLANPESSTPLGENFFKLRIANSSIPTGKSGGFRVITYYRHQKTLYLVTLYSKTDQDTVQTETLKAIIQEVLHS